MKIETDRLVLREMNKGDLDALYAAMLADPVIVRRYPHLFNKEKVRELIMRNIERYRIFGFGLWAVCLKDTGEMIGECGLTMELIDGNIRPEIDYHIRRDMQRKGYATEAASAVRDWAFENTPFHEIYSYAKYHNIITAKTAQSWGCSCIGEFDDGADGTKKVYVITKSDWLKMIS